MDKTTIVEYANAVLKGNWHPKNEKTLNLVHEYLEFKVPKKADTIYQAYIQMPDEIKVKCVEGMLKNLVEHFHINTLKIVHKTQFGDVQKTICYLND